MGIGGVFALNLGGSSGGGGVGAAFSTIQPDAGTSPVATGADTLTLTSSDASVTITGNSGTDTIDFSALALGTILKLLPDTNVALWTNTAGLTAAGGQLHIKARNNPDYTTDGIAFEGPSGGFNTGHLFHMIPFGTVFGMFADGTGFGEACWATTNQAKVYFGAGGIDYYKVNLGQSSTNTNPASPAGNDPIFAVFNRNTTVGNYTGILFNNGGFTPVAHLVAVNEDHGGAGAAQGRFELYTAKTGTLSPAIAITSDQRIKNLSSANESAATLGTAAATAYLKVEMSTGAVRYIPLVTTPN